MRTEKLGVILIAVAFMLVVIFSSVGLFSLKKIDVDFSVSKNMNSEQIQKTLDGYLGENLLFFNAGKIYDSLKDNPYVEVVSVKKDYPNVLRVEINERREVFLIHSGEKYFATTDEGFVLRELQKSEFELSRDKILLDFDGVTLTNIVVGQTLSCDNVDVLSTVIEMAKSVNLTDCIKKITVKALAGIREYNAEFKTHSGVKMIIEDLMDLGVDKTLNAFNAYDNILTDYQKADGEIQSYVMYDERFRVTYNQQEVWTSGN